MRLSSASVWLFLILAVRSSVTGAEIEWLGSVDSGLRNPANWEDGVVPGIDDTAIINSDAADRFGYLRVYGDLHVKTDNRFPEFRCAGVALRGN